MLKCIETSIVFVFTRFSASVHVMPGFSMSPSASYAHFAKVSSPFFAENELRRNSREFFRAFFFAPFLLLVGKGLVMAIFAGVFFLEKMSLDVGSNSTREKVETFLFLFLRQVVI